MNAAARHLNAIIDSVGDTTLSEVAFVEEIHALADYTYGCGEQPCLIGFDQSDFEEYSLEVEWVDIANIPF